MKQFPRIIFIVCIGIYIILGLGSVFLADLKVGDENWHFTASSLVAKGKVPYRDFAYFHLPLVPYFYGAGMYLFGSNLIVGRLLSFLLGLLSIVFIYKASRRLKDEYAGVFSIIILVFNFNIVHKSTVFYWGPLENFLLALFCFSLVTDLKPAVKYSISTALLVLAQGARYFLDNMSIFTLLFVIFIILINRKDKKLIIGVVISYIGTSLLIYLPWFLLARKEFLFDTLTHYFSNRYIVTLGKDFSTGYTLLIHIYDRIKQLLSLFRNYYVVILSLLFMGIYAFNRLFYVIKNRMNITDFIIQNKIYFILSALVIFNIIFYLAIFGHHLQYFLYHAFPAWAILFGCATAKLLEYIKGSREKLFFNLFVFSLIFLNLFTQEIEDYVSSPNYSGSKFLNTVAKAIEYHTEPGDKVFAFTNGYVLQAHREVFPNTIYDASGTSLFNILSDEEAEEYNLLNSNILLSYFKDKKAKVVVLENPGRLDNLPRDYTSEIKKILSYNYHLAETIYKYPDKDVPEPAVYIYKLKK